MSLQEIALGRVLMWLKTWQSGGLLWTRQWTFRLHITRGISCLDEEPFDSQQRLCCMYLATAVNI